MTICLALVCDDGKSVVAVADRMVSVETLSLQFEQGTRKIERLGAKFAALTAGDALAQTDLLRDASSAISQLSGPSVREVAEGVAGIFTSHRQALAEKLVLRRVGMDYEAFLKQQQKLLPEFTAELWAAYQEILLGVQLLVVGVDSTGAHLYRISDPGIAQCFDSIGYAAIGSGLPHAEGFLTQADYSPQISLSKGIWLAYVAKRQSERAPGVGSHFTDILTITPEDGAGNFLSASAIQELERLYEGYSSDLAEAERAIDLAIAQAEMTITDSGTESESAPGGEDDG